jgi:CheY-like chemotaxis protein
MPEMDGFEVAKRIRADARFQDVQLVAVTGWGQEQYRQKSEAHGFDHHLVKPVRIAELHTVLQRARV